MGPPILRTNNLKDIKAKEQEALRSHNNKPIQGIVSHKPTRKASTKKPKIYKKERVNKEAAGVIETKASQKAKAKIPLVEWKPDGNKLTIHTPGADAVAHEKATAPTHLSEGRKDSNEPVYVPIGGDFASLDEYRKKTPQDVLMPAIDLVQGDGEGKGKETGKGEVEMGFEYIKTQAPGKELWTCRIWRWFEGLE